MSITDELREWANGFNGPWKRNEEALRAIADRIDAEHERVCKEQYACGAEHGIGASIEASMIQEHGFIELPKDADGVPIRVGDVTDKGDVTCIRDCGKGWEVVLNNLSTFDAPSLHHHKPTVEDVLREFGDKVCNSGHQWGLDAADTIAEYATKFRLANDGEEA